MDTIHVLALTAGALNATAFLLYNKDIFFGSTRPNAATVFLWALVTAVNAASYYRMNVDWATLVVIVSDTTLCTVTFLFLLFAGKFGKLSKDNYVVIWLSIAAIIVWKITSARQGNLMAQIPMILSFLPILKDTRSGKTLEDPRVWVLWTSSFVINLVVVCFTWSNREDFVYPIVAIVMHSLLTYYAFRGRRLYARPVTAN